MYHAVRVKVAAGFKIEFSPASRDYSEPVTNFPFLWCIMRCVYSPVSNSESCISQGQAEKAQ
jgi:hypothetical protein